MTTPITALDHLRIAVADLDAESAHYATLLGREPEWTGRLDGQGASIFATDNVQVVLLASSGAPGLAGACFRVGDLERLQRRLKRLGIGYRDAPDPLATAAGAPASRGPVTAAAAECRGLALSFAQREPATPAPAPRDTAAVTGLDHIVIASGDAEATAFTLGAQLGLDMRMDISRPQWDARLMFFRCGDLIVEVFQQLSRTDGGSDRDSFYGLSWRVADADAARATLAEHGFDVSEVRDGRRPGTRVLTVRSGTGGVATLLIEHATA